MIKQDKVPHSEKQAQFFIKESVDILEMIATGQPASDIYNSIALMYEARNPGMRCSLLELKGNKLMHGGAPSLPKEYCDAVNGLEFGPSVGSCGTSTYTGKQVLVENIETDPKWSEIKHVALPHGMRCCWSKPIKDSNGNVLGAFGMYYDYPALPNENELNDLKSAARLTGIVMERDQRERTLKESIQKYKALFENSNDGIILHDLQGNIVDSNINANKILGYDRDALNQLSVHMIHPDSEMSKSKKALRKTKKKTHYKFESRFVKKDGSIIDVDISSSIVDPKTNIVQGIFRDITEKKQYEKKLIQEKQKLEKALNEIKTLSGLLPICASCKKIRDDKGYWNQIESYIQRHSGAEFSHSMCPECSEKLYGDEDWYIELKKKKA